MEIFSLSFIFFFLPVTMLVFSIVPQLYRAFVLLVASIFFMAMTSPVNALIMVISVLVDYRLSRVIFIRGKGDPKGKASIYLAAAKNILLVIYMSIACRQSGLVFPLGATVYAFTSLGYLIDLYNKECEPITSVYDYTVFCCFFGKLNVGPIVSSRDFYPQLQSLKPQLAVMGEGCIWFCHGLAKKVILADNILLMATELRAIPYQEKTVAGVWLLVLCYLFSTYFTLSGYSDMARGLGAFFGFTLPENFHYPLQSLSVTDFFSNFNISANRFVRKYVYGALGAEDNGKLATTVNIMLITMLMGMWYGITLNLLIWGGLLGLFIVWETMMGDRLLRVPSFIRWLGTLGLVVVSFAIFCGSTLEQSTFYLRSMFGLELLELIDSNVLYLLSSNLILLIMCAVFSTSFFSRRGKMLQHRFPAASNLCSLTVNLCIFVVALSFML